MRGLLVAIVLTALVVASGCTCPGCGGRARGQIHIARGKLVPRSSAEGGEAFYEVIEPLRGDTEAGSVIRVRFYEGTEPREGLPGDALLILMSDEDMREDFERYPELIYYWALGGDAYRGILPDVRGAVTSILQMSSSLLVENAPHLRMKKATALAAARSLAQKARGRAAAEKARYDADRDRGYGWSVYIEWGNIVDDDAWVRIGDDGKIKTAELTILRSDGEVDVVDLRHSTFEIEKK